ncbi:FecR domain-containing protein [Variovorax sp. GB1P17]|uniref:FecR domain-containing protein n=1 Tax=Variovorax sp. GB1P17 TaxID=3443740 RepID=UPI003F47E1E0
MSEHSNIDPIIVREAAAWLVKLQSGEMSDAERSEWQQWRARSAMHQEVWRKAEMIPHRFDAIPPAIGMPALDRPTTDRSRRAALRTLSILLTAAPAAWFATRLPWKDWAADYRTATGEQRNIVLADGTQLVLNTASAIDVTFSETRRLLQLHEGEVLVTTAHEAGDLARSFLVTTGHGAVRALGTRFSVRRENAGSRVAVFEGAVQVEPADSHAGTRILQAGSQCTFTRADSGATRPVSEASASWAQGILVAEEMRLDDFLAELSRYRVGTVGCDPAVAGMLVSGAFQLKDTDRALALLTQNLPLRIDWRTRYWGTVRAA